MVEGNEVQFEMLSKVSPVLKFSEGTQAIKNEINTKEGRLLRTIEKDRGAFRKVKEGTEVISSSVIARGSVYSEQSVTIYIRGMEGLSKKI